jgi:hypothetical protein
MYKNQINQTKISCKGVGNDMGNKYFKKKNFTTITEQKKKKIIK